MKTYKERLAQITTIILDFDGVLTNGVVYLMHPNDFVRTMNVRDSYAIQFAVKNGLHVAVITGGNNIGVKERMAYLGVTDVYLQAADKLAVYSQYKSEKKIADHEVLYIGDDLPDFHALKNAGIAACPNDAVQEIKEIAHYVSPHKGGEGCVRDVIEQIMKAQNKWFKP